MDVKETKASQYIEFTIECPECEHELCLTDGDYEGHFMELLFTNKGIIQTALAGEIIECPECEKEFKITGTDY